MDLTAPAQLARGQALARVVLGTALLVAPAPITRVWIGRVARAPGARALAQGLGARDVAIGLGTLRALSAGSGASPWVRAGVAGDAADFLATLVAWRALPTSGALAVATLAGSATALGLWLQANGERLAPGA